MKEELVTTMISVKIQLLPEDSKQLLILASAQVPTPGWTEPELEPRNRKSLPNDGIYEFNFLALPPSDPVPQVLSHIEVKYVFPLPPDLKIVRIYARTNNMEARLERAQELAR